MPTPPVLVIEDDPDLRDAIVTLLRAHDYSVLSAEHGAQVLEVLTRGPERPGLIVLDLMMPVMDGLTFRRKLLAEHPELARIPTVVVTALWEDAPAVRNFPAIARLSKPFGADELMDLVARYCGVP